MSQAIHLTQSTLKALGKRALPFRVNAPKRILGNTPLHRLVVFKQALIV